LLHDGELVANIKSLGDKVSHKRAKHGDRREYQVMYVGRQIDWRNGLTVTAVTEAADMNQKRFCYASLRDERSKAIAQQLCANSV